MIDFHSHILPEMDDGSRSVEESVLMLKALAEQGTEKVVATPHFYANDESVLSFLSRRRASFEKLEASDSHLMPKVILGAEVRFYDGISKLEGLDSLCIQGTRLLLLEMSMQRWTEYTLKEIIDISCRGKVIPVIAHLDRYMKFQSSDALNRLLANGVLMQINANFVYGLLTRRKAFGLLKNSAVHFLGSDCHNLSDRAPDIGKAFDIIKNKLGRDFLLSFENYANEFFE